MLFHTSLNEYWKYSIALFTPVNDTVTVMVDYQMGKQI